MAKKSSVPSRGLLPISSISRALRFPIVFGTVPVKWLDSSASADNWDRLPTKAGNDPVS
jgi:hypothetical protein